MRVRVRVRVLHEHRNFANVGGIDHGPALLSLDEAVELIVGVAVEFGAGCAVADPDVHLAEGAREG